ncbi:hypothetical protein H2200_001420 [Cladophialophora chaetospira]|uniref:C6 zinc finger domain protein n=1 Tax=Cladophialophora chaetospira TaxID=386627 RepID=A0AA38XL48_9EURO|nr:hypothetical protein H2200_001420 [Cladophialophora chaetospira]
MKTVRHYGVDQSGPPLPTKLPPRDIQPVSEAAYKQTHLLVTRSGNAPLSHCLPSNFNATTARAFQYFREKTLPMLLYVNPSPAANYVFQHLIPQTFQDQIAVKHAIVAIASAHELLSSNADRAATLTDIALHGYGQTLRILGNPSVQLSTEVMLVSCIVFIGYETLLESPKNASLHLENGLRMIRQYKRTTSKSRAAAFEESVVSVYMEPVFAHLEAIFSKSSASDIEEAGDLSYHPPVLPQQFNSLLEVRGKMLELWMHFLSKHPADSIDAATQLQVLPTWEQWYVRLLHFTRHSRTWPVRDQLQARLLCVHYDMLNIALQCQRQKDETAWDQYLDKFQGILATCYDICHNPETYQRSQDPNDMDFFIAPGVLPPLWLLGTSCRDPLMRRKAVELLRIHHKRCGHMDECSAVAQIEVVVRLEEHGIPLARACGDIPKPTVFESWSPILPSQA